MTHMFNGCYMQHTISHTGKWGFRVFDNERRPMLTVKEITVKNIAPIWIFKKTAGNKYTLNLNMVRRLNGNAWIKKEYKRIFLLNKNKTND